MSKRTGIPLLLFSLSCATIIPRCVWEPLTLADTDTMLSGMKQLCAGGIPGKPFENLVGSGTEYTFGDWSILCCNKTDVAT